MFKNNIFKELLTRLLIPYCFSTFSFSCLKQASILSWNGLSASVTLFPWIRIPSVRKGIWNGKLYFISFSDLLSNVIRTQWEFHLSCIHKSCQHKNTCKNGANLCKMSLFVIRKQRLYKSYCYCYSTKLIFTWYLCPVQFFYYPYFYVYNFIDKSIFICF